MTRHRTSTCLYLCVLCVSLTAACSNSDPTIARANGTSITQAQWDEYVKVKQLQLHTDEQKARALDEYAANVGLAGAIEHEKLLDEQAIQTELEAAKRQLLIDRYFEKYLESKVSDAAVQAYYDAHQADYEDPSVHVAQILFRIDPRMTEDEIKAKRAAAQSAYEQLRAGKDFAELAMSVSEDPGSRKNGGDLGWYRAGAANAAFVQRAFKLKAGELTEPVQTATGLQIIKLLEPIKMVEKPFPQVQVSIRNQLRAAAKAAEMERLMAKAQIEVRGKPREAVRVETQVNTARADR